MLREIFKAVLADFCRETGWAHYGTVWLVRRTCHPQSLQLRSRLCESHSSVNEQSPFGAQGITLNKDILYALTYCLERQRTCF